MAIWRHVAICIALALSAANPPVLAQSTSSSPALQVHVPTPSSDADDASALAAKLQNPIGDLISAPFQSNANFNVGPNRGTQEILNIQPVIPIHLNEDWNLITRTTLTAPRPSTSARPSPQVSSEATGFKPILQRVGL